MGKRSQGLFFLAFTGRKARFLWNAARIKQIAKKTKIDFERMPITLDRFGNTSGASAIVSMCDRYGNSDEHKTIKVMACGFGIGISLGATSFEINTDDILPIYEDDAIFEEGLITDPNQLYEKK